MFLTDGGTEEPEELFEQYNPNKTVCSNGLFYIHCEAKNTQKIIDHNIKADYIGF